MTTVGSKHQISFGYTDRFIYSLNNINSENSLTSKKHFYIIAPMLRQARLDVLGALHRIMARGIDKSDIFGDNEDKAQFHERLGQNVTEGECPVYARVLMTNCVHLLFKSGISSVMRKLLTWYTQYYNHRHNRTGPSFLRSGWICICSQQDGTVHFLN